MDTITTQSSFARTIVRKAITRVQAGDVRAVLDVVERASRLDPGGALEHYAVLRALLYERLGIATPAKALRLYNSAFCAQEQGRYDDALALYAAADVADGGFPWSANNAAWLLATCPLRTVRNGVEAMVYAERACHATDWSYWCFIGTFAAACADKGDLALAVEYQKQSLRCIPADHQREARLILQYFERGEAFTDYGIKLAAGGQPLTNGSSRLHTGTGRLQ